MLRVVLCSGWLCYPGKLKRCLGGLGLVEAEQGSGWLCYPGKLKRELLPEEVPSDELLVPDGFAIRGS